MYKNLEMQLKQVQQQIKMEQRKVSELKNVKYANGGIYLAHDQAKRKLANLEYREKQLNERLRQLNMEK